MSDCPRGSSGWWAWRDAQGEGSSLVNNVRGLWATLNERPEGFPDNLAVAEFNLPVGPAGRAARLTTSQAADLAKWLGYGQRVKDAPFNSMGQAVFTNGRNYISLDVTMHAGANATWKLFSRHGQRIGTYNFDLSKLLGQ